MHTSITMYNAHFALRVYLSVQEISASLCKFFMSKIYTQPLRKWIPIPNCTLYGYIHVPSKIKTIKQL